MQHNGNGLRGNPDPCQSLRQRLEEERKTRRQESQITNELNCMITSGDPNYINDMSYDEKLKLHKQMNQIDDIEFFEDTTPMDCE
ncbi:hypothetical protein QTN25_007375 [Entamoeba marina]